MRIRFHARTDCGLVRQRNEDNFLILNSAQRRAVTALDNAQIGARTCATELEANNGSIVFAVADGMGGVLAGEVASAIAVCSLRDYLQQDIDGQKGLRAGDEPLRDAVIFANKRVCETAIEQPKRCRGMGTTLTVSRVLFDPRSAQPVLEVAHVGDSRAYLVRGGQIKQLTQDQTMVESLVMRGVITPEEARSHPQRHIILQALGQPTIEPELSTVRLTNGDTLVVCSDGLTEHLADEEISILIEKADDDLAQATCSLVTEANRRGGRDNTTVIVARFGGVTLDSQADLAHSALARHAAVYARAESRTAQPPALGYKTPKGASKTCLP